MKKLTLAVISAIAFSQPVFAQSPAISPAYLPQAGSMGAQLAGTLALPLMMGPAEIAAPFASITDGLPSFGSDGNLALVAQEGDRNSATIHQRGRRNIGIVQQVGFNNASTIRQTGTGHQAALIQRGNSNTAFIVQR